MNCRYCGNVYTDTDRTCGGCGAPKHAFAQTLLDAPATPEHWSNSLKDTIYRVLIATVAIAVLVVGAGAVGLGGLASVLAFFWAIPAAPTMLTYAAWRDAKGDVGAFLLRLFLIFWLWASLFFVMLMVIGLTAAL